MLKSKALSAVLISLFSIVTPLRAANPMAFVCEENCFSGCGALDFAVLVLVLVAAGAAWGFWRVAFAAFSYLDFIALIFLIPLAALRFYQSDDSAAWELIIWAVGIAGAIKFGFSVLDASYKSVEVSSASDTQRVTVQPASTSLIVVPAATSIIEKNDCAVHGRSLDSASLVAARSSAKSPLTDLHLKLSEAKNGPVGDEEEEEVEELGTVTLMLPDGHIDTDALRIFAGSFNAQVEDRREIKGGLWVLQGQEKERSHHDDMAQILAVAGFKWSEVRIGWYVH